MEEFTDDHIKSLLSREWLVKVDSAKSKPYLFKYSSSLVDLSCYFMITDTKSVWAEVLTPKLVARRWRSCNKSSPDSFADEGDEEVWRERLIELLSKAHTMGGTTDMSFEIVESNFADLGVEIQFENFKWKWETCFVGHKKSSEIISKHLIFPLISLNHLAFSSAESLGEMADGDVEKAVDKLGRTARRTVDNHVKNALSKPKVASAIQRMTAMFNFMPDLSSVTSTAEKPLLELEEEDLTVATKVLAKAVYQPPTRRKSPSPTPVIQPRVGTPKAVVTSKTDPPESSTESESEDEKPSKPVVKPSQHIPSSKPGPVSSVPAEPSSIPESPPSRPTKKARPSSPSSSDDSDVNMNSRAGSTVASNTTRRTTKQPIKRGGKRF
ncbi:hypothetical protein CPC08DRAFT_815535 [Agrocybe pediades]|nr:hypothetical protein CPC08DRAFT_815535 [Agrocybe pediades]